MSGIDEQQEMTTEEIFRRITFDVYRAMGLFGWGKRNVRNR